MRSSIKVRRTSMSRIGIVAIHEPSANPPTHVSGNSSPPERRGSAHSVILASEVFLPTTEFQLINFYQHYLLGELGASSVLN
jgi:hypothetical protein